MQIIGTAIRVAGQYARTFILPVLLGLLAAAAQAQTSQWVIASYEYDSFTVGGTQTVRFGDADSWVQASVSGTVACTVATFGSDPLPGEYKRCELLMPAAGNSAVTLTSSANPSALGQTVTVTANLSPASAGGTVIFRSGGTELGRANLSNGSAALTHNFTRSGSHGLNAVYLGDASHDPAMSATVGQTVNGVSGGQWTKMVDEWGSFSVSGVRTVRYGDGTSWLYALVDGIVECHYWYFGIDPAENQTKQCDLLNVAAAPLPPVPVSPAPVANYEYDANGNRTRVIQAPGVSGFGFATATTYDRLNRARNTTDARNGVVQRDYNGREDLTQVTDPRSLVTSYPRDGLGQATGLTSPDTGTASHTYDAAGNLLTRTDSRGVLGTYSYDALNRLTGIVYSLSGSSRSYGWTYDQTGSGFANGIGRLTTATFPEGSTRFTYDAQGRLSSSVQTVNAAAGANASALTHTTGYGYDAAGNVTSITYPSGRVLSITHTDGVPSAIGLAADAGATPVGLIGAIQWEPFGAAKSWQWQLDSGTQAHDRVYDSSGRLVRYRLGGVVRDLSYDAADRISAYTHYDAFTAAANPSLDQSFGYDELGRLTGVTTASASWAIGYDANGNRTSVTQSGATRAYTTAASSNRLTALSNPAVAFTHDNAGNTLTGSTAATAYSSTYLLDNRLGTITANGVTSTYSYNNAGQRVRKFASSGAGSTVVFVYDQQGHLLGEYDSTGAAIREYVWLGDEPVAVFMPNGANPPSVYYVHNDHINTPRTVVDRSNNLRWRWLAEPFGTTAPETNPSNLGAFAFNLRMPGQYADSETGLLQNWHRDYDASIGRYVQSDPIGLDGGVNTYAYVGGDPVAAVDPAGLQAQPAPASPAPASPPRAFPPAANQPRFTPAPTASIPWWARPSALVMLACMPGNAGQAQAQCNDDPWGEKKQCGDDDCDQRNEDVKKAKDRVSRVGACSAGMTRTQLRERADAWLALAIARARRDQKCWAGGDEGHQQAQASAWEHVGRCQGMLR